MKNSIYIPNTVLNKNFWWTGLLDDGRFSFCFIKFVFIVRNFVLIIWKCFFNGLARTRPDLTAPSLSRYTELTVFTFKKEPLNENTVNYFEMCSNARNYLSNERFCMKFGRFFAETVKRNIRKFRRVVHTEIYRVFKVKNRKKCQSGSLECNYNWTWK